MIWVLIWIFGFCWGSERHGLRLGILHLFCCGLSWIACGAVSLMDFRVRWGRWVLGDLEFGMRNVGRSEKEDLFQWGFGDLRFGCENCKRSREREEREIFVIFANSQVLLEVWKWNGKAVACGIWQLVGFGLGNGLGVGTYLTKLTPSDVKRAGLAQILAQMGPTRPARNLS